jgi:hypothetical protein
VEGGYQANCYKLLPSCILASIPERAHSTRLGEAFTRGAAQEAEEISL